MSGYFSNKDHQLEAKIFSDYRCGMNIQIIAERNKVSQMKVKALVYEWMAEIEQSRKDIEAEKNRFSKSVFDRHKTSNFILCTDDEKVLTAYLKMTNVKNPPKIPKEKKTRQKPKAMA